MSDKLLENLFKKTRKSRVFGIRIPARIYLIYELLDFNAEDIAELRQLISAFIVTKAIEKGFNEIPEEIKAEFKDLVNKTTQNNSVIFNININKAEAKNTVNIDISKLVEKLNELQRLLLEIQKNNFNPQRNAYILPPARMKDVQKIVEELRGLVN